MFFILLLVELTLTETPESMIKQCYNYFNETIYSEVSDHITALAVLESGWFRGNKVHKKFNNYFGMNEAIIERRHHRCRKRPIYCLKQFESFEDSLKYMLVYFERNNYPTDPKGFLDRLNGVGGLKYAKDPKHVQKVIRVRQTLHRKGFFK